MHVVLADTHGPVLGKAQPSPNLGLLYLASFARERLPGVRFHYLPQRRARESHFEAIERHDARVYALSFTSYGAEVAYGLMREVKRRHPDVLVVAGGAHVTAVPEEVLELGGADVCVLSEGEETFVELLARRDEGPAALASIPGIAYRTEQGTRRNPLRPWLADLDSVPLPARDLIDPRDYVGISYRRGRPATEMIVTRGCPYRCVFCANPVFRGDGPLYRPRSPESIAAEAELLYRQGYRELYLHSDELNVRLDWSIEVCRALAALGHRDLFFQANLRVAPMSEEFARWLRRANFWMVRFGIESGSQRVLSGTKKKMALSRTLSACRLVSAQGIRVFGYFLAFQFWEREGKLEWETLEEVEASLALARRLWREGVLHYSSWMIPIPVQGAELYDIALRHGLITAPHVPRDDWDPSLHHPALTREQLRSVFRRARWLQGQMALRAGAFEIRNWRSLWTKGRSLLSGTAASGPPAR